MNSKVGEIFTAAGQAFSRLGDLTMQLHPNGETQADKWTEEEMEMLHASITRFSDDLAKISLSIKNRTVSQIRQTLKKKAFEEAGIPAKQVPVQQVQHVIQTVSSTQAQPPQQSQLLQLQQTNNQQQPQQQQQQQVIKQQQTGTVVAGSPIVAVTTTQPQVSTISQQQSQQQQHQAIHIQHVQHLIPVQQNVLQNTACNQTQILQATPKQIIIQQASPQTVQVSGTTATSQIVHLQPQQLQQLQQGHVQTHHQQQIIQPAQTNSTTTTITLAQFQQLQAQKALLAAAASSSASTSSSPTNTNAIRINSSTPNTTSTVMAPTISNIPDSNLMNVTTQQSQQQSTIVVTTTVPTNATNLVTVNNINALNAVTINNTKCGTIVGSNGGAVVNNNSGNITTLKSGPDVTMTLNRINTQENEVDVEECLPADVVKLDFTGEEVAG